jgi:hypothetical protein
MKVRFFYRDGDNYKCCWLQDVDDNIWNEVKGEVESEGEKIEEFLDTGFGSDHLFEITDFGLTMQDIPLIKQYGQTNMDHPYVSIIEYGEDLV